MDIFEGNDKYSPPIRPCTKLLNFKPLTEEQGLNLINQMHYTTCKMDPCNTIFLMKFKDTLIGIMTKIINVSLTDWTISRCMESSSSQTPHKMTTFRHWVQEHIAQ